MGRDAGRAVPPGSALLHAFGAYNINNMNNDS